MFKVGDIVIPNPVHGAPPPDLESDGRYHIIEILKSHSKLGVGFGGGYGVKIKGSEYEYGASWFVYDKENNIQKLLNKIDNG